MKDVYEFHKSIPKEYFEVFTQMQEALVSYGFDCQTGGTFTRKIAERVTLDIVWTTNFFLKRPHWQASLWFDENVEISLSTNFKVEDLRDPIILQLLICG